MHASPPAPSPRASAEQILRAALAEAWHVDANYGAAAAAWEELARAGVVPEESALKVAAAHLSAGRTSLGLEWLRRAANSGCPAGEVAYVRGQALWQLGQVAAAERSLREAHRAVPDSARAAAALAALYWQAGQKRQAAGWLRSAAERDAQDIQLACNAAQLAHSSGGAPDWRQLARAAAVAPEQLAPHVLYARGLARAGAAPEQVQAALARGRMRRARRVPSEGAAPRSSGTACGRVGPQGLDLEVAIDCPPGGALRLELNAGLELRVLGGATPDPVAPKSGAADAVHVYSVTVHAPPLRLAIAGRASPPGAAWGPRRVELGSSSAWLPRGVGFTVEWTLALAPVEGWTLFASADPVHGADLVLLPAGAPSLAAGRDLPAVYAEAPDFPRPELLRVARVAQLAADLWARWLDRSPRAVPPLVVVDRPRSSFCYARRGYLRLSSGAALDPAGASLILHEVGHLSFGLEATFGAEAQWLAEGLAEYGLHLAEERGLVQGHRAQTLHALADNPWAHRSLRALAADPSPQSQACLRDKAGYLCAMLRARVGDQVFREWLRLLLELGRTRAVSEYAALALLSRLHGRSLGWFVAQWVESPGRMALVLDQVSVRPVAGGQRLELRAAVEGELRPGFPVELSLELVDGQVRTLQLPLELGPWCESLLLEEAPRRLCLDPALRIYACRRRACWLRPEEEVP